MAKYEIQHLTLNGGVTIPAYKVVCPQCMTLDLKTDFRTDVMPWVAICTKGHQFEIDPRPEA
jgi:hypothetical protein